MKFDPTAHHSPFGSAQGRHSIRLKGYDYAQSGGYYVTLVTQGRENLFGEIHNAEMIRNEAGEMLAQWWNELPHKFPSITVDTFVVMPNHFHGIIIIHDESVGAGLVPAPLGATTPVPAVLAQARVAPTIGEIIGAFKSITTHEYICGVKQSGWHPFTGKLWQRNYYEHILRDQSDWERIRAYIADNPLNWKEDEENPANSNP
jgi:putative transposase